MVPARERQALDERRLGAPPAEIRGALCIIEEVYYGEHCGLREDLRQFRDDILAPADRDKPFVDDGHTQWQRSHCSWSVDIHLEQRGFHRKQLKPVTTAGGVTVQPAGVNAAPSAMLDAQDGATNNPGAKMA